MKNSVKICVCFGLLMCIALFGVACEEFGISSFGDTSKTETELASSEETTLADDPTETSDTEETSEETSKETSKESTKDTTDTDTATGAGIGNAGANTETGWGPIIRPE